MRCFGAGRLLAAFALPLLAGTGVQAEDVKTGALTIEHPWTRATPAGAQVAGGYLTVVNRGAVPDRLLGGSIAPALTGALHAMAMAGTVMTMRPTGPLAVPAGGSLTLDPSGTHLMFTGLKRPLKAGETVPGTLVFDHAGTVAVRFTVEGLGARAPRDSGAAGHPMPGMRMD